MDSQRIRDELETAFRGPSWHGPALREVLEGITAEQAFARPVAGAHSIAELVSHLRAWKAIVRRRVEGEAPRRMSDAEDWPQPGPGPAGWAGLLADLEEEHRRLVAVASSLAPEALSRPLADETVASSLIGAAHHDLYHGGQIALLRKARGRAAG
jgi:uncharacterized damage-inducible protein DinB